MHLARFYPALAALALLIGLVLPTVLPEVANAGFFVIAGLALLLLARSAPWAQLLRRPGVALPLIAGAILTLCFIVTAREPWHGLAAVFFMPLFLVAPVAALLRVAPNAVNPQTVGLAALAGCVGAAAVALFDTTVLGLSRAGVTVNNPIHFADLSLMLGFVSLVGVHAQRPWVRTVSLAGPVLALLAVLLSGSRGPLLAFVPMLIVAVTVLIVRVGWRRAKWRTLAGAGLAGIILIAAASHAGLIREVTAFSDVARVLRNEAVDSSTEKRLIMYQSAYNALQASPVFGHGLIGYVQAAARHAPPGVDFPAYGHLHNDIADFSVVAGGLGLLSYGLFLLAPVVEALRRPRSWPAINLALSMSIGYFAMGLTNAMFGVLSQTVLYGVCLALVVHFAGERRAAVPMERAS